jgi:hypothetical protein
MKNLLLFLFSLLTYYGFSQSCTHTIQRTDTWGDGWNGGLVSVSVNGVTVLSNLSCVGAGPTSSNFTATAGQIIRVWRTAAGSYPYEMRIRVISSSGAVVINTIEPLSGTSSSGGRVGTATCGAPPPPVSCTNTYSYLTATMPSTPGLFYVGTCTFQGDYNTFNSVVAGNQYRSSYSLGGWITVRHTTPGGTVVASGSSPLTWTAPVSGTYYIHYNTNSGCGTAFSCGTDYIECLSCVAIPPPSNDLVCNATAITCGQTLSGTTVNAGNYGTGEGGFCSVSQTQPGVWYVVSGNGQIMTANLCATAWDSKISVFSGPNCSTLSCVGGNDDYGPSCASSSASFSWTSAVGTNYYILVHGYSTSSSFSINLTCVAPPTPGPCINTISYGTQSLPVFGGISYTTVPCQFAGEYSTWSGAVVGTPYIAMTTVATDWITVRSGAYNGTVVAVGLGPLSFTPTNNNTLYIHVNTNSLCGTVNVCRDVSVTRMSALPIELLSFEGKKQVNSNMLYWSTASEHNTSHFIIEKSVDGFKWSDIGQVPSAGNSTQKIDYSLEDIDVSQVINYYRLHQYDIDGVNEVFGPIAINNRDKIKIITKTINAAGQEVGPNATGIVIEIYTDGTIRRVIR